MFAAFFSFAVNGEVLSGEALLGAAFILGSIVLGELRVTLPPPPDWLPAALRPRWERARAAQLQAAAEAEAVAEGKPAGEGEEATAKDIELSERVSLLGGSDEA
jgi:hypothetical protein